MPKSKPSDANKDILAKEISRLKVENLALKQKLKPKNQPSRLSWRMIAAWFCALLAAALLIVGNLFFWTGNTIVDTNRYIKTVGPVIQQKSVQTALAGYTTKQIFSNYDVQGIVQSVLPPRADFLAPQLTTQLKNGTQTSLEKVLASSKFQQVWANAQRKNHDRLIHIAKNYEGNGQIYLGDIFKALTDNLAGTKLSFLVGKQLPSNLSTIHIATAGWLPVLHKLSINIGLYQTIATGLLLALTGLAIWLATKRRRMVIGISVIFAASMLISLISIRIAKTLIVSGINPDYQQAVRDTLNIVLHPLAVQTFSLLLASCLAGVVAWISGPYHSASIFRDRVQILLSGQMHQFIFGDKENSLTLWTGRHKRWLQWGSVGLVAAIMLLIQLSPLAILFCALAILLLVSGIELLAAQSK